MQKILLLASAIGVIGANSLSLSPMASSVASSFPSADAPAVMIAAAAYGLATAVGGLALAPLADRYGAHRILWIALTAFAAAMAAAAASPDLPALSAAQAVAGLAAGAAIPSIYTLASQIARPGEETTTIGYVLTGWTVSMVGGVGLAGVVSDFSHWRWAFAALGVLALVIAAAAARAAQWGRSVPAERTTPWLALRTPGAPMALLGVAGFMVAFYGAYSFLGPHLTGPLGVGASFAGAVSVSYGLGFGAAAGLDRFLRNTTETLIVVFCALSLSYVALAAAASSASALFGLAAALGFVNHLALNLLVARLTALAPARRGAIMGLYSAVTYLSVTAGALGFRPIFETYGFAACAIIAAVCVLAAAMILFGAEKRRQRVSFSSDASSSDGRLKSASGS